MILVKRGRKHHSLSDRSNGVSWYEMILVKRGRKPFFFTSFSFFFDMKWSSLKGDGNNIFILATVVIVVKRYEMILVKRGRKPCTKLIQIAQPIRYEMILVKRGRKLTIIYLSMFKSLADMKWSSLKGDGNLTSSRSPWILKSVIWNDPR